MIKRFDDFLNEGGETSASPGSGMAVGGGPQGSFASSAGQSVYGGDSGSAFATNSNTSGMGAIHSAQPSSIPGDVAGSKAGSGDIGSNGGIYTKTPAGNNKKKKKNMKKRKNYLIGKEIDEYTSKPRKNESHIITNWDDFND